MTSTHSMFPVIGRLCFCAIARAMALIAPVVLTACGPTRERLNQPTTLVAPYGQPQLWAVAPFLNESGVSIVKGDRIADIMTEQAEDIDGVATLPVNRVLAGMQRLQLRQITSPAEAMSLMNVLGVDGLIVGSVTAYDPYNPPKFGAAVQLWRRESSRTAAIDPTSLTRSSSEPASPGAMAVNEPAAQASGLFDASNHQVLAWLDQYAAGRTEPNSAYGKRIYLVNMELYTQFVAFRLLHDLLHVERMRLHPEATQPER